MYEVTNAQYKEFMDATSYKAPTLWSNPAYNAPNQPVVGVSWYDAVAYAEWAGKRLPTEAEWERAARGGLVGMKYPWGNEDPNGTQCNLADSSCINYDWAIKNINDGYQYTAPVGSFPPNGYGLYDMAGNVWEFCIDWYDPSYYTNPPKQNPTGPNSGTTRVMRGGSWLDPTFLYFSVSHHHSDSPKASWFGGGFRCVSSVTSSERRLSITPAEVAPGTQASVQLGINNATGITSGDILLKYDPKVITIGETKGTDLISNMTFIVNKDVSGELKLSMAGIEGIENGSGALIDIAFTANQSTRLNSETKLEFVYANFYDQSGKTIPVELENGIIKIIQGGIKGDVNGDNQVRSNDATLALRITAGLTTPTAYQLWAADMNNDGQVRSNDATLILRKAAGLLAPLNEPIVNGRNVIIGLNEVYGLAGNSITVPVKVDRADIIASGDVCIAYDSSILRAVDILSESDLLLVNNITESGMIRITFASADGLKSNTIANIKFEVLTDKVSPITFHKAELYRLDTTPIDSKTVNGRFQSLAMRPEHDGLLQNFPNPFNPETWIPYQLRNDSQVKIHIYTIKGELIRTLELGYKPAGIYSSQDRSAYWDGKNESGEYASSGVYFYTIKAGDFTATKKMIIQK